MEFVTRGTDASSKDLGNGVSRRVLAHDEGIMIVEVTFEAGAEGAPHTHPHRQATYILSGRYVFSVEGEAREVSAGDTLVFPPNAVHGTKCLEGGKILDIFSPMREDFLA